MRAALPLAALVLLPGCATMTQQLDREGRLVDSAGRDWRSVATGSDQDRLRGWRSAFVAGLKDARATDAANVAAEAVLLRPDAALTQPAIPNGSFACRTIKLGAQSEGMPGYVAYPAFTCRIRAEGGLQRLIKLTGSQRPIGLIYPGDALRSVFLGTLMLGEETRPLQYGGDTERDMAGYVERIGPRRWRLILPSPAFESKIDVIELVPTK